MQRTQKIYYDFADTSIGKLLVAANDSGICFIEIGDTEEEMLAELKINFIHAEPVKPISKDITYTAKIIQLIDNPEKPVDIAISQSGTDFQQKVWSELQKIPAGEVISYAQLAQRMGRPKAVRAVANACAKNNLAIIIPCHRVIGSNGSLTGYRWGIDKKKILLEREQNARQ